MSNYITTDTRPRAYVGPRARHAGMLAGCCSSCDTGGKCESLSGLSDKKTLAVVGVLAAVAWFALRKPTKTRKNPKRKWVKGAIKKKGSLRRTVARRYGDAGFTRSPSTGRKIIKRRVLEELAHKPGTTGKRARLAMTMRRF